ncbi:hypothetical protein [Conexibacter sp. SYSU D00693]|uniref:hypothetical protein n=1 Tax=Conexibacter sp. SYSU D00693 TaxID=2812560 RepID=UPI00196AAE43|nr:hypothetical protein [Conexibacter sp. SYSU D00693]
MAFQEAHDWWADVQSDRDDLDTGARGRRRVAVWADDDFDLVPAHVIGRPPVSDELASRRAARRAQQDLAEPRRRTAQDADVWDDFGLDEDEPPTRGHRFVRTHHEPTGATALEDAEAFVDDEPAPAPRRIVLEQDDTMAPPPGADGGVIRITGRPEERRAAAATAREPRRAPMSARDRVESAPDRVMLWMVSLSVLLLLLAFVTS